MSYDSDEFYLAQTPGEIDRKLVPAALADCGVPVVVHMSRVREKAWLRVLASTPRFLFRRWTPTAPAQPELMQAILTERSVAG